MVFCFNRYEVEPQFCMSSALRLNPGDAHVREPQRRDTRGSASTRGPRKGHAVMKPNSRGLLTILGGAPRFTQLCVRLC